MPDLFQRNRVKVFIIRAVLGIVFAGMLARLFFPGAGLSLPIALAVLLVFFSYAFEYSHRR